MILLNLIRKEIICFFRNKANVTTMFIFPIVLIVIMGFSLNGLMDSDYNIFENQIVYYKVNNIKSENKYLQLFLDFKQSCEENMKVKFEEILDDSKGIKNVNSYKGLAYINIYEDSYNFYRNQKKESISQKIFRNGFEQFLERYVVIEAIAYENSTSIDNLIKATSNIKVKEEEIFIKGISSFEYYTFAELILIILYISQITNSAMYKENVENTIERLKISKSNDFSIIASKVILGTIVGIIQVIVVYIVSKFFLEVNWGEKLIELIMVLISLIIFSSILGVAVSLVFKDNKSASSLINILLIVLGFLGGSYLPISLIKSNLITNMLCLITPTYWANISLLSLSSGIKTNYPIISIMISLELSLILLSICIISRRLKLGENID